MPGIRYLITLAIVLSVVLGASTAVAQEKIIFAATLIRHGDRSPIHHIKTSPCTWTPGLGELTPVGINQEYLLGKSLRARYVDELGLLPPKYRDDSIYARSSDYNRTIMSAQAFLCGLYPPGTGPLLDNSEPALPGALQLIPVRTVPRDQDYLILGHNRYEKRFDEVLHTTVFNTLPWQKMTASCADRFPNWSRIFGRKIENLEDLITPGDNVNVRLLKGVPLPEGLTEVEAREIIRLFKWAMAQGYKQKEISRLIAGDLLWDVFEHMQQAVKGRDEYRFVLYSGHDSTVLPVMAALGVPLDTAPPYASNICFELYRDTEKYHVKVRYNGSDVVLPSAGGKSSCTYEQFRSLVLLGD